VTTARATIARATATGLFAKAQAGPGRQSAPSASRKTRPTRESPARPKPSGTARQHLPSGQTTTPSLPRAGKPEFAFTGTCRRAASPTCIGTATEKTSAPDAERRITELRAVRDARSKRALTPLNADAWERHLVETGLIARYPNLPSYIRHGFPLGPGKILRTFTPENSPSLLQYHQFFENNVRHEHEKGRWLGPYSRAEVEAALGPFQTSPLSIIPKPAKPGAYRLIQNFSYPRSPIDGIISINAGLVVSDWPCSWGSFFVVAITLSGLPEGSEGAVRDISEAFRACPIRVEDWSKIVVCTGKNQFNIDTVLAFGNSLGTGLNGQQGDGSADIMRARGIGPVSVWVDDYNFLRVLREKVEEYNAHRARVHQSIIRAGGRVVENGRFYYPGGLLPDGRQAEYVEDHAFPIQDLSQSVPRSEHDKKFAYNMADISGIANELGVIFDQAKDVDFSPRFPFAGFDWSIPDLTVGLLEKKRVKYLQCIAAWKAERQHSCRDVQSLLGKLMHASTIYPAGRAYLVGMAALLRAYDPNRPFALRYSTKRVESDLGWWQDRLAGSGRRRRLPIPAEVADVDAYSDASSEIGIAIWIRGWWRAWWLVPDWDAKGSGRNIGWAEAVGFELLVRALAARDRDTGRLDNGHVKVWGDNRGVVEAWWKGCSNNHPTNEVFKRLHTFLEPLGLTIHTRYVRSANNPADEPSRGVLGPRDRLLPRIALDPELAPLLRECDDADGNLVHPPAGRSAAPKLIDAEQRQRRELVNARAERTDLDLIEFLSSRDI
jgi:hypothetical protein